MTEQLAILRLKKSIGMLGKPELMNEGITCDFLK